MTATATTSRRRSVVRVAALVVGGLVLVALAVGPPAERGEALDPDGTGPAGARGLVLLLEELGAEVDVVEGPPPDGADTAVLLRDLLTRSDTDVAVDWVEDGGVLLVADPLSSLFPFVDDTPCPAALAGAETLSVGDGDGVEVDADDGAEGTCFDGLVWATDVGTGSIVGIDGAEPLLNERLDEADNAVLAAAVLAPAPGTRVAFVVGPSPDADDGADSLVDLVTSPVRQALVQGGIALVVWVAWRARRLGRPIVEEQPVAVAGSELVVAVGHLLDARRQPHEAADLLRAEARRLVASRLGLAADTDTRTLAAAVAARSSVELDRAAAALGERPVQTDDDLLAVAADLDQIRTDVLGSRTT